jgi:hypothetical protein
MIAPVVMPALRTGAYFIVYVMSSVTKRVFIAGGTAAIGLPLLFMVNRHRAIHSNRFHRPHTSSPGPGPDERHLLICEKIGWPALCWKNLEYVGLTESNGSKHPVNLSLLDREILSDRDAWYT